MDSQTTSPAPDPLATTLHNDKAEINEFSNTAHDTFKEVPAAGAGQAVENRASESGQTHLLQASVTLALQGSLTQPDDDYNPVPATISLTLPHELVERILLLLDTKSMLKCRLVHREFNTIIQSSTLVQYYLACKAAGVIDNPQSPLSYAERLETLKRREGAWRKLTPLFETTVQVNHKMSTLYGLTAGNYFLRSDKDWKDLYYCHLPSSPQDNSPWLKIPSHGPGQSWSGSIVGMGVAIYEHDLVVNVVCSRVGNQVEMQLFSFDLVLFKLSTGEYHPLAHHPVVHVQRSPDVTPIISVKIVGSNVALVFDDYQDGSKLFIFDWKTGHRRLKHETTRTAYQSSIPVFISPELLLVPNRTLSSFEVWHLFPSHHDPKPPVQILSLKIPTVSANYAIRGIYCHGELSPFLHSMPYFPPRPFFPSSENSIIVFSLFLQSRSRALQRLQYKIVIHRHASLDIIQKWTSPSLLAQQEGLPRWLTNDITECKAADPDDGLVRLGAQSKLVSAMPHPGSRRTRDSPTLATDQISPTDPTSCIPADSSSSSASSTSRYDIIQVQWADWGPPISRWFRVNISSRVRLQILQSWDSTGQRCVFSDLNPRDNKICMIGVADFNQHRVRRNAEMMAQPRGEGEDNDGNGNNGKRNKEENEEDLEILDHEGEFSEEVYMGLKCVVYQVPGEYDFDAVLMDEERLLGLKFDGLSGVESIKVFYLG